MMPRDGPTGQVGLAKPFWQTLVSVGSSKKFPKFER